MEEAKKQNEQNENIVLPPHDAIAGTIFLITSATVQNAIAPANVAYAKEENPDHDKFARYIVHLYSKLITDVAQQLAFVTDINITDLEQMDRFAGFMNINRPSWVSTEAMEQVVKVIRDIIEKMTAHVAAVEQLTDEYGDKLKELYETNPRRKDKTK